jgi:hypothetical protein
MNEFNGDGLRANLMENAWENGIGDIQVLMYFARG